jgi:hypothetical protein
MLDDIPPIRLRGTPLSVVNNFKYLCHILATDLKDDSDIERERRALSIRANMIVRRLVCCTTEVKLTLFKAYCTTFYTCSLWLKYNKKND